MVEKRMNSREHHLLGILRDRTYIKQNGKCYWCSCQMNKIANDPQQVTGDHIVPLYAGGKTAPDNVVASCRKCNSERNPETNKGIGNITCGDDKPTSPFEVLIGKMKT